jgi:uncharacterized protein (TIGR02996 family)
MSEAAFFAQILAAPDDRSLQHVYADWLEERGDSRCEFVRLQAELAVADPARRKERLPRLRELLEQLAPLPNVLVDLTAFTVEWRHLLGDDVPWLMAELYKIFPLGKKGAEFIVAIGIPTRGEVSLIVRDLELFLGERVIPVVAHAGQVADFVAKTGVSTEDEIFDVIDSIEIDRQRGTSVSIV